MNIADIGYRLVQENQKKYLGAEVARWKLDLEPRDKHFDRRITVTTPLQKAGAYLVTAKVADGNTSQDRPLARRHGDRPQADAGQVVLLRGRRRHRRADRQGQRRVLRLPAAAHRRQQLSGRHQELRRAHRRRRPGLAADSRRRQRRDRSASSSGSSPPRRPTAGSPTSASTTSGAAEYYDAEYNEVKTFAITDRPVYRPGQTVEFKFWVRQAQYDPDDKSTFAHQSFAVEIHNPKGEKVYSETLTADDYGGIAGKFELPADATLGQYQLHVVNRGGGTFRVEEYKKPEFEVTVEAPTEPVMLGEKITATIRAKYYFGSPVTNATVKYKVLRSEHTARWYPPGPWDWLYGPGYWWFAYDYDWYPGWRDWGCRRPAPWWCWRQPSPPEVVAEREVPIGADGTVEVEIDTALAKAAAPRPGPPLLDSGRSRRPIAAHDRRHRRRARRPQAVRSVRLGRPRLLPRRRHDRRQLRRPPARRQAGRRHRQAAAAEDHLRRRAERKPIETEVRTWNLDTERRRPRRQSDQGLRSGPVSPVVSRDRQGRPRDRRRLPLHDHRRRLRRQRVPLQRPGARPRQARVRAGREGQAAVNTNRVGATVLLFVRPSNGVYLPPQVLRLDGKSTVVEIDVDAEGHAELLRRGGHRSPTAASTPRSARSSSRRRSACSTSKSCPRPTSTSRASRPRSSVKLTDADGKPFVGSTVLSIYDKSVEYISGGSNVPRSRSSSGSGGGSIGRTRKRTSTAGSPTSCRPARTAMENLGVFGDTVADEVDVDDRRRIRSATASAASAAARTA